MCLICVKSLSKSSDTVVCYKVFYKNRKGYRFPFAMSNKQRHQQNKVFVSSTGPGFHAFRYLKDARITAKEIRDYREWNIKDRFDDEKVVICKVILYNRLKNGFLNRW